MNDVTQLIIEAVPAGPIDTNAWIIIEPVTQQALIIDAPPDALEPLRVHLQHHNATPIALVVTHTHWDHIGAVAAVREAYNIPVMVHAIERGRLEKPVGGPVEIAPSIVDQTLADGDTVALGHVEFVVMHTPGHSPGQISLYDAVHNALFGGDTLFPNGYGRVDIPGASEEETVATITRLLELPDDVTVYPGHGNATKIGTERPWMQVVAQTGQLL